MSRYSELPEAVSGQHVQSTYPEVDLYHSAPEVDYRDSSAPEPVHGAVQNQQPFLHPSPATKYAESYALDSSYGHPQSYGQPQSYGHPEPAPIATPPPRRICGIARRTFIILVVAIVVVIIIAGAVVGGVVGSRASHGGSSSSSGGDGGSGGGSNNTSSGQTISLISGSSIAAVNLTSPGGPSAYQVYTQKANGDVQVSVWDPSKKSWTTTVASIGPAFSLTPQNGTPIAATSWGGSSSSDSFQTRLYLLTADRVIHELQTSGTKGDGFNHGTLGQADSSKFVVPAGSSLSATAPVYRDGTRPFVLWQQGNVQALNYTGVGDNGWKKIVMTPADNRTGLAIINQYPRTISQADPEFRLFVQGGGTILEQRDIPIQGLYVGTAAFNNQAATTTTPYAAALSGWFEVMFVAVDNKGALLCNYYFRDAGWSMALKLNFLNTPDGVSQSSVFQSVAVTEDGQIFGVVNGKVYWWSFSITSPANWTFQGMVG